MRFSSTSSIARNLLMRNSQFCLIFPPPRQHLIHQCVRCLSQSNRINSTWLIENNENAEERERNHRKQKQKCLHTDSQFIQSDVSECVCIASIFGIYFAHLLAAKLISISRCRTHMFPGNHRIQMISKAFSMSPIFHASKCSIPQRIKYTEIVPLLRHFINNRHDIDRCSTNRHQRRQRQQQPLADSPFSVSKINWKSMRL